MSRIASALLTFSIQPRALYYAAGNPPCIPGCAAVLVERYAAAGPLARRTASAPRSPSMLLIGVACACIRSPRASRAGGRLSPADDHMNTWHRTHVGRVRHLQTFLGLYRILMGISPLENKHFFFPKVLCEVSSPGVPACGNLLVLRIRAVRAGLGYAGPFSVGGQRQKV